MSERRTVDGEMADGIADRGQGYTHNPNPADEVAAQRARFEAAQAKLQEKRHESAEAIEEVQTNLGQQFEEAINDPEHQKFVAEQVEHEQTDPSFFVGGQERAGDDVVTRVLPGNIESGRQVPLPTTPRNAEDFNNEEGTPRRD